MNNSVTYFSNLGDVIVASFQTSLATVVAYLPKIIGALIILIVGWIIASILGNIVRRVLAASGIDNVVERAGVNERLHISSKYRILSSMIGQFVKWFIILVTLIAVASSLNLPQITTFLNQVALYIPRAIAAVVILAVGMLLAEFLAGLLQRGLEASRIQMQHRNVLPTVAKWSIIVFSFMAALVQLGIVPRLIEILFGGIVLALALAFGLGGREEAARLLASLRQQRT